IIAASSAACAHVYTNLCAMLTIVRNPPHPRSTSMPKPFRGSYTVSITPFTEDGSAIDVPALRRFLDWQLEVGVPGIIILGPTGEFLPVTDEERRLYVDTTVKHIAGRIPVLVGAMNAHTPNAVRYSREAQELGADGLMILPPYYYTPTEDEIFGYYK